MTPVLLEAGVPYIPLMGNDLVYQLLLSADPVAINKLLLMFSRSVNTPAGGGGIGCGYWLVVGGELESGEWFSRTGVPTDRKRGCLQCVQSA